MTRRTEKLNSLLREVISEVIRAEVRDPDVSPLATITRVDITKDLREAKVFVSVIGEELAQKKTVRALQSASGFIGICSAKRVVLRHFPTLTFKLDKAAEEQLRIHTLMTEVQEERKERDTDEGNSPS